MPDYENSLEASTGFDFDAVEDREDVEKCVYSLGDLLEVVRRYIRYIRSKDRTRLTLDCIYLSVGDEDAVVETMTSIAEKHGVTKAAVSKRTKEIRQDLHLSINANNKSEAAVRKYRNNRSPIRIASIA